MWVFDVASVITLIAAAAIVIVGFAWAGQWGLLSVFGGLAKGGLVGYLGLVGMGAAGPSAFATVLGWVALVGGGIATLVTAFYACGLSWLGRAFAGPSAEQTWFEVIMVGVLIGFASIVLTAVKVLFLS